LGFTRQVATQQICQEQMGQIRLDSVQLLSVVAVVLVQMVLQVGLVGRAAEAVDLVLDQVVLEQQVKEMPAVQVEDHLTDLAAAEVPAVLVPLVQLRPTAVLVGHTLLLG
jgi:hypothetical protein